MPVDITINGLTGLSPYDVYVCDNPNTICVYIDTINSGDLPYTFQVPEPWETMSSFTLQVTDSNGCNITQVLTP